MDLSLLLPIIAESILSEYGLNVSDPNALVNAIEIKDKDKFKEYLYGEIDEI